MLKTNKHKWNLICGLYEELRIYLSVVKKQQRFSFSVFGCSCFRVCACQCVEKVEIDWFLMNLFYFLTIFFTSNHTMIYGLMKFNFLPFWDFGFWQLFHFLQYLFKSTFKKNLLYFNFLFVGLIQFTL